MPNQFTPNSYNGGRPKNTVEWFYHFIYTSKPTDCWPWTGALNDLGYGTFRLDGKQWSAHRLSYTLAYGPIPDGLYVCHSCDNPPCCNPGHLWLGTAAENNDDKIAKGRQPSGTTSFPSLHPERMPRGDQHWAKRHPEIYQRGDEHWSHRRPQYLARGEGHGNAKLTEEDVRQIKRELASGEIHRVIASHFGVSRVTIDNINSGKIWRHVTS